MSPGRPLALGLVSVPIDCTRARRTGHRVRLALYADAAGYSLVETFEVDGRTVPDEVALRETKRLAGRVSARVLIVAGHVDRARVAEVAKAAGMSVRQVPNAAPTAGPAPTPDRS